LGSQWDHSKAAVRRRARGPTDDGTAALGRVGVSPLLASIVVLFGIIAMRADVIWSAQEPDPKAEGRAPRRVES